MMHWGLCPGRSDPPESLTTWDHWPHVTRGGSLHRARLWPFLEGGRGPQAPARALGGHMADFYPPRPKQAAANWA